MSMLRSMIEKEGRKEIERKLRFEIKKSNLNLQRGADEERSHLYI